MCGRYTLGCVDAQELREGLPFDAFSETRIELRPRFNIAPGQRNPVVLLENGEAAIVEATWGFDRRDGGLLINARSETAKKSRRFREAFSHGRCIVPADGFFEWRREDGVRQPYLFRPEGGGLLLMAGLCEDDRYVVLTCPSSGTVAEIHDRMPVQVQPDDADRWLTDGALGDPHALERVRVSRRVNRIEHDDPDCIALAPQEAFDFG